LPRTIDVLPVVPILTLATTLGLIFLGVLPFSPQLGVFINVLVQLFAYISTRTLTLSDTEKRAISLLRSRVELGEEEFRNDLEGLIGEMTVDGLVSKLQQKGLVKLTTVGDKTIRRVVTLSLKAKCLY
jgi:hypothetical protein